MTAMQRLSQMNPLQYTAVLVRLTISQWRPEVQAPELASEVEGAHKAQRGVVRVRRARIVHPLLTQIDATVAAFRSTHYRMTGAWGTRGIQMLPIVMLPSYEKLERQFRDEFQRLVTEFTSHYTEIVQGQAEVLGGLYRPSDYPSAEAVRSCYGWDVSYSPVPAAAPWWAQLPKEVAERLEADAQREARAGVESVMKDVHTRLTDALSKLAITLSGESNRWHSTLLSNALEIADLLPSLNVTGNSDLTRIADEIKALLAPKGRPLAMDALKDDDDLRSTVAAAARDLTKRAKRVDPFANLAGVL